MGLLYTIKLRIRGTRDYRFIILGSSKSYTERERVRDIATLQKIEKQHTKIISFLFKMDLPSNDRMLWYKAYLELRKLHSIELIKTLEIKEEAESDRSVFIEQLRSIEKSDPVKTSLRWQFFTGVTNWQTNNETWEEIYRKENIGAAFLQADDFDNYDKKDNVKNLSPYHTLAVYHFIHTGRCPDADDIELPKIETAPSNKKELIAKILIDGISPEWLHHSGYEGLIHYLFEFYTQTSDESINKIHS